MDNLMRLGDKVYSIDRRDEDIYIITHNLRGEVIESFHFKERDLALDWTDEYVLATNNYCGSKKRSRRWRSASTRLKREMTPKRR
jgi:hypothetical protein